MIVDKAYVKTVESIILMCLYGTMQVGVYMHVPKICLGVGVYGVCLWSQ